MRAEEKKEKIILRPRDIMELTGFGPAKVYSLWKKPDFPGRRDGRTLFVLRDAFFEWLEGKSSQEG